MSKAQTREEAHARSARKGPFGLGAWQGYHGKEPKMLTIAFVVMILGLILYLLPGTPNASWAKANEVGRIMFQVGLFFVLWAFGAHILKL